MNFARPVKMLVLAAMIASQSAIALAQAPAAPARPAAPLDRLSALLAQAGIKRCAPIVRSVAAFLVENGNAAFVVKALGQIPDRSPVMLTVESAHAALGTTRYASIIVLPSESCSGYYEQSIYWGSSCAAVKAQNFANFPATKPLLRNINASAASPTVSLMLMPAGQGCVSIKKEIFR